MMTFKYKHTFPPGGRYYYTVPETGVFFSSVISMLDLEAQVRRHYLINKVECPENLTARIEDHICRNSPDGFCDGVADGALAKYRNLTLWGVEKRTRRMLESRPAVASDAVSEQRVTICMNCPENLRNFCTSCNGLRDVVRSLMGGRKLSLDSYLGVCGVCGVMTASLCLVENPKPEFDSAAPASCWLTRSVSNG